MVDIGGVVGARLCRDPEIGAEEGSPDLRDKLFHGVGVIAEALAELACHAGFRARPVGQLVQEHGIPAFGGGARGRVLEAAAVGHGDAVVGAVIEGAVAALGDGRPRALDEGISRRDGVDGVNAQVDLFALVAVHLLDVEDAGGFDHEAAVEAGQAVFPLCVIALELLVEDDERRLLAFAHLCATVLPLAVGAPEPLGIAAGCGRSPEGDGVDAAIGVARRDVLRARDGSAARVPGHGNLPRPRLDGGDDLVGNGFIDVEALFGLGGHVVSPRLGLEAAPHARP